MEEIKRWWRFGDALVVMNASDKTGDAVVRVSVDVWKGRQMRGVAAGAVGQ